jgi:hypothetical protein
MTLARLLTVVLVLCSLPALAQDLQAQAAAVSTPACAEIRTGCPVSGNIVGSKTFFFLDPTTAAAAWQPLKPTSNRPADVRSGYNALDPARLNQYQFDQIKSAPALRLKVETLDADVTCYTIRTYVVARDSKDSDATHPAGYSTCQPSAQYQLKTTVLRSGTQDR